MKSSIYWGSVWHKRLEPKRHAFSYPHFTLCLNLKELKSLPVSSLLLANNRFALMSIKNRDYLGGKGNNLHEMLAEFLKSEGLQEMPTSVSLITLPRVLGYVFNPVSFFVGRSSSGAIHFVVAEVHNTFGESHLYLLRSEERKEEFSPVSYKFKKEFFVSPFFPAQGEYRLTVDSIDDSLSISVHLEEKGRVIFSAGVKGSRRQLNNRNLALTIMKYPCCVLFAMLRIQFQALLLFLRKKVEVYEKPIPFSKYTVKSIQNCTDHFRLMVLSGMRRLKTFTQMF